jgi:hypothetical protein
MVARNYTLADRCQPGDQNHSPSVEVVGQALTEGEEMVATSCLIALEAARHGETSVGTW